MGSLFNHRKHRKHGRRRKGISKKFSFSCLSCISWLKKRIDSRPACRRQWDLMHQRFRRNRSPDRSNQCCSQSFTTLVNCSPFLTTKVTKHTKIDTWKKNPVLCLLWLKKRGDRQPAYRSAQDAASAPRSRFGFRVRVDVSTNERRGF